MAEGHHTSSASLLAGLPSSSRFSVASCTGCSCPSCPTLVPRPLKRPHSALCACGGGPAQRLAAGAHTTALLCRRSDGAAAGGRRADGATARQASAPPQSPVQRDLAGDLTASATAPPPRQIVTCYFSSRRPPLHHVLPSPQRGVCAWRCAGVSWAGIEPQRRAPLKARGPIGVPKWWTHRNCMGPPLAAIWMAPLPPWPAAWPLTP